MSTLKCNPQQIGVCVEARLQEDNYVAIPKDKKHD